MADSRVIIDEGTGLSIDTRTESTNSQHRQVVVLGDPDTNANVADVQNEDPGPTSALQGLVVRLAGSATVTPAGGTFRVFLDSATGLPAGTSTLGSMAVFFNPSVPGINVASQASGNTLRIFLDSATGLPAGVNTLGSIAVFYSPAVPAVKDIGATAVLSSTVSGTVNTAGGSGSNTLISPEASRNIKVYAYSLTTTAQVGISPRFTDGRTGGTGEFWRVALLAPAAGIAGANLAVTPPGYLFATGIGNTLALFLDSASLVHYSVAYFKESA